MTEVYAGLDVSDKTTHLFAQPPDRYLAGTDIT